jgi:hypothetical protein
MSAWTKEGLQQILTQVDRPWQQGELCPLDDDNDDDDTDDNNNNNNNKFNLSMCLTN